MTKLRRISMFAGGIILFSAVILFLFGSTTHSTLNGSAANKVEGFVDKYANENNFNGVILVSKEKEILLSKGYGYANLNQRIMNEQETLFHIASLTKSFTALAILQLEEKGKLSVTDSISAFFTDYPNADHIQIHHLLTHTSGIPDFLNSSPQKMNTVHMK